MHRNSNFLDFGIEVDIDPKIKFNSLLSATISTIMCLAAKCPLPKGNVETTRMFLSKITDESGNRPRNIGVILQLLQQYNGPYDTDKSPVAVTEKRLEKKNRSENGDKLCIQNESSMLKASQSSVRIHAVDGQVEVDSSQAMVKRPTKTLSSKRSEKDPKKLVKTLSSKIPTTKSSVGKP